jgi:hypothetical protein
LVGHAGVQLAADAQQGRALQVVPFRAEGGTPLLEHALDVFGPGLGVYGVANTSTTAPASMPVAPESVIQAADVYWPGGRAACWIPALR